MIQIAIVQFPGSNCERETRLAVSRVGMQPVDFFWNSPREALARFDGYILVGGFSCEDRSRAGIIAAMDPLMADIREQAALGKPVLGIGNGAQILVEAGLVPGLEGHETAISLTDNLRVQAGSVVGTGFYNAWVHMRLADDEPLTAFTKHLSARDVLRVPVAHAEGRFVIPPVLLSEMQQQGMRIFQYCDAKGVITPSFPVNPNGSVDNIAAISNRAGNVLAIMPHPERTEAGDALFRAMREYIAVGHVQKVRPLRYAVQRPEQRPFRCPKRQRECIVALSVTDNHAASVEMLFKKQGISLRLRRYVHWQVDCEEDAVLEAMLASGFLYNPRKEGLVTPEYVRKHPCLLVQPKEDVTGRRLARVLQQHFAIKGLSSLRHGILWQIEMTDREGLDVMSSPLFCNPVSHDAWSY